MFENVIVLTWHSHYVAHIWQIMAVGRLFRSVMVVQQCVLTRFLHRVATRTTDSALLCAAFGVICGQQA